MEFALPGEGPSSGAAGGGSWTAVAAGQRLASRRGGGPARGRQRVDALRKESSIILAWDSVRQSRIKGLPRLLTEDLKDKPAREGRTQGDGWAIQAPSKAGQVFISSNSVASGQTFPAFALSKLKSKNIIR